MSNALAMGFKMNQKQSDFTAVTELDDSVYIGAFTTSENERIKFSDLKNQLKTELQNIYTVDTVADMVPQSFGLGSLVQTKGCLTVGDGGQGTFIVEEFSGIDDGYSRILLVNGNHAVLQGEFNNKQFGADFADAIEAALAVKDTVTVLPGLYNLDRSLSLTSKVIKIQTGATITGSGSFGDALVIRESGNVIAFGRGAENAGSEYQGLQIGGGDPLYGSDGVYAAPDGHASWMRLQPSKNESPIEMLLYNTSSSGIAVTVNGTNELDRTSGTYFTASWIGRRIYFGDTAYLVASVPNANKLTVTTLGGGAVSFSGAVSETYHVAYIGGTGTCTVSGGTVTRVSGDPFIAFISGGFRFFLGSTQYTVSSFINSNQYTITSPPADGTYTYTFSQCINDQLTTFRIQKLYGSNEENLSMYARYDGYWFSTQFAGSGKYRKLFLGSGEISSGNLCRQLVLQTNGDLSIGGDYNYEAIRVLASGFGAVNRFDFQGAGTGFSPAIRGRGSDTNVGIGYDTQGTGEHTFTSGSFGRTNFKIGGTAGSDYLRVDNGSGDATLSAAGSSANIDLSLTPKGTGLVSFGTLTAAADAPVNGYIQIKTASGTTIKLATIA